LRQLFFSDADVERPKVEAELLCVVMLAKQVELNPSINAESLIKEQHQTESTNQKHIGLCPKCKSEVLEGSTGYFCKRGQCGFKIAGVFMGQVLNTSQVKKLLQNGRTDLLSDFVYESGERFSACLIINDGGNVRLEFPTVNR
jgi:DNA topoisomerase-3